VGEYFGKLKDELGLGDLTHESFTQLLQGINPTTGELLVRSKSGKKGVIPAFDFTFSPPKSISLAYELAIAKGDDKLLANIVKAHDNAVNAALKHIEKEEIKARVQKNGKRKVLEPQLHTHSVVMNLTKIDGKYKALDTGTLLRKGSKTVKNLGQFYRESLKHELRKNGLELRDTDKEQSFFELQEVDDKLIKAFSSRTFEIKKEIFALKKKHPNLTESQLSLRAFFGTRKAIQQEL